MWGDCDAMQAELWPRQFGPHAEDGMVQLGTHQMSGQAMRRAGDHRDDLITTPNSRGSMPCP
jgi:hypothetical protein